MRAHPNLSAIRPFGRLLLLVLAACLASCNNIEETRIRQLLVEAGFGTQADGRARIENYVAGGDGIVFLVDPALLATPGAEQLPLLTIPQTVNLDGTILLPMVGPVKVLGLTERDLKRLVESQLAPYFTANLDIRVTPRIIDRGKAFYAFGEVGNKGRVPYQKADLNLFEAITMLGPTALANMGRVRLVKPDAENPLVVEVNFRQMVESGHMRYNLPIDENDIIYIPPTWIGGLARFVEKITQPLAIVVQTLFGVAQIRYSYDIIQGDAPMGYFRF